MKLKMLYFNGKLWILFDSEIDQKLTYFLSLVQYKGRL